MSTSPKTEWLRLLSTPWYVSVPNLLVRCHIFLVSINTAFFIMCARFGSLQVHKISKVVRSKFAVYREHFPPAEVPSSGTSDMLATRTSAHSSMIPLYQQHLLPNANPNSHGILVREQSPAYLDHHTTGNAPSPVSRSNTESSINAAAAFATTGSRSERTERNDRKTRTESTDSFATLPGELLLQSNDFYGTLLAKFIIYLISYCGTNMYSA